MCRQSVVEYGDPTGVMGNGWGSHPTPWHDLTPYDLIDLGMDPAEVGGMRRMRW